MNKCNQYIILAITKITAILCGTVLLCLGAYLSPPNPSLITIGSLMITTSLGIETTQLIKKAKKGENKNGR